MNKRRWRIHPHDLDRVSVLERNAGVPPVVAQLLICRGLEEPTRVKSFLEARLSGLRDPEDLPGIKQAVACLSDAIAAKRRITIYGDYDADGMTGTAVLYSCLHLLGANVGYFIPSRLEDGYGLHSSALKKLADTGTQVVVSVDCGIASLEPAETARELGLDLIVTDHHSMADRLPRATAIVHPQLPGTAYPFGGLCGAGVAFKLAWALCQQASDAKKVSPRMRDYLMSAVGIAAIGTVADVVPLIDENRLIVRHGLRSLRERPCTGLKALLEVTGLADKPSLTSEDIAFTLAPRLNAAGRLGQAQLGVELLTTTSTDRAQALAEYIHELNKSRDSLERSIYLAAVKEIKDNFDPESDPGLVLAGTGWHPGVIGIVASRIAEKYHLPTVMIALDKAGVKPGTGSGRSACGLNLHQAFAACSHHLLTHGGHAAAAGLKIEEANVDAFRADFCEYAAGTVKPADRIAEIQIDAEATLNELTVKTVQQIEMLAPFGAGNPRPILCATGVELAQPPQKMGGGERHLSLRVRQHRCTVRAVAFGQADWADELAQIQGPIDIAYRPVINDFRGFRKVEMHLVDWRSKADN